VGAQVGDETVSAPQNWKCDLCCGNHVHTSPGTNRSHSAIPILARRREIFLEARSDATNSRPYPTGFEPSRYGAVDILKLHRSEIGSVVYCGDGVTSASLRIGLGGHRCQAEVRALRHRARAQHLVQDSQSGIFAEVRERGSVGEVAISGTCCRLAG